MNRKILIFSCLFFIFGLLSGVFIHKHFWPKKIPHFQSVRGTGFKYTSPLLYCEAPQENGKFVQQLNDTLVNEINNIYQTGLAANVSVYLRFPKISDWTVINGEEKYSPASLLKVPVMMVYYNQSGFRPSVLSKEIKYDIDDDNQKTNYKPKDNLEKGKSYTVDDLIKRMIVYSDNTAEDMLTMNINKHDFDRVFDDIKINRLNYDQQEDSMDVKTYSYFFRVLYNSTFLSREVSEKALGLLTQTSFNQGIVAGVPKNIPVAHKFGERFFLDSKIAQLHDCGIVYYPNNPYLLCIMTRGKTFENLESVIKKISETTYQYVKQQSTQNQTNDQ